MPLISDSKSVYVGTTPITRVMAGTILVWENGRDCDDAGKPGRPVNFRVDTLFNDASQYGCTLQWQAVNGTNWKFETELKLSGANSWTNKKFADYPLNYTSYKKNEFGPNPTLQKQTEVRCRIIDPSGNESCYVYEFPRS